MTSAVVELVLLTSGSSDEVQFKSTCGEKSSEFGQDLGYMILDLVWVLNGFTLISLSRDIGP